MKRSGIIENGHNLQIGSNARNNGVEGYFRNK